MSSGESSSGEYDSATQRQPTMRTFIASMLALMLGSLTAPALAQWRPHSGDQGGRHADAARARAGRAHRGHVHRHYGYGRHAYGGGPAPVLDLELAGACESAFTLPQDEQRCMALALGARQPFNFVGVVRACESAFDGDQNELACVETAAARGVGADSIRACESAFDGDHNELACVGRAPLPAAVSACETTFDGDDNEIRCLDAVQGSRYEPSSLVAWCDQSAMGDDAELACLIQFR